MSSPSWVEYMAPKLCPRQRQHIVFRPDSSSYQALISTPTLVGELGQPRCRESLLVARVDLRPDHLGVAQLEREARRVVRGEVLLLRVDA